MPAEYFEYNATGWSALPGVLGPPYSADGRLAYDSTLEGLVYLYPDSAGASGPILSVWEFSQGRWTGPVAGPAPPPRLGGTLADDPADGGVLLFGGANTSTGAGLNDTWVLNRTGWSRVALTGGAPGPRVDAGAAWDPAISAVVLLGGCPSVGTVHCANDTWTYALGTWSSDPVRPPATRNSTTFRWLVAQDPSDHRLLAVPVGYGPAGNRSSGFAVLTAKGWSASGQTGPPSAGNSTALASLNWEPTSALLEIGDRSSNASEPSWGWLERSSTWSSAAPPVPPARSGAAMDYDATLGSFLLYGGTAPGSPASRFGDSWAWSNSSWRRLSPVDAPPPSGNVAMAYDAGDGYSLLFDGTTAETWAFTGGNWVRVVSSQSPPASARFSLVDDPADGYLLWLGEARSGATESFRYSAGAWTALSGPAPGPPSNPLVYDPTARRVVEVGPVPACTTALPCTPASNETWTYANGNWTNRTPIAGPSPSARSGAAALGDPSVGGLVLFGGADPVTPDRVRNDTWWYANGSWSPFRGTYGPSGRSGASAAYDTADRLGLVFGGNGSAADSSGCRAAGGDCNDTWTWGAPGGRLPYVLGFAASRDPVDVGVTTLLSVVGAAGTPPYRAAFDGLPAGCSATDPFNRSCRPVTSGSFVVSVTITDAAGLSASASLALTVEPSLGIVAFVARPSPGRLGDLERFTVSVLGGSSPRAFAYFGLPDGCANVSAAALACRPTRSGNYSVEVAVEDPGGGIAAQWVYLEVDPAGSAPGPTILDYSFGPPSVALGNATRLQFDVVSTGDPLTYAYAGLPPGCPSPPAPTLSCTPVAAGTYSISFRASDPLGRSANLTANLTVRPAGGGDGASILFFGPAPDPGIVGTPMVFEVAASGGTGPLSYSYPELPAGCGSANSSWLRCVPTSAGTYPLYVVVADAAGHRSGAFGSAVVVAPALGGPNITMFVAAPSLVRVGVPTSFSVTVAGGTAPLRYNYSGLPNGCLDEDVEPLSCTPAVTGNFTVALEVTDAAGHSANATATLQVLPALPVPEHHGGGGVGGFIELGSWSAAATVAFVIASAAVLVAIELALRRRRHRAEGEALVRALGDPAPGAPPTDGAPVEG